MTSDLTAADDEVPMLSFRGIRADDPSDVEHLVRWGNDRSMRDHEREE